MKIGDMAKLRESYDQQNRLLQDPAAVPVLGIEWPSDGEVSLWGLEVANNQICCVDLRYGAKPGEDGPILGIRSDLGTRRVMSLGDKEVPPIQADDFVRGYHYFAVSDPVTSWKAGIELDILGVQFQLVSSPDNRFWFIQGRCTVDHRRIVLTMAGSEVNPLDLGIHRVSTKVLQGLLARRKAEIPPD